MTAKTQHDIDLADLLLAMVKAILAAFMWPFRVLNALAFPAEPADELDAGTARLIAATAELEREERLSTAPRRGLAPVARDDTLASLARRYLANECNLPAIRHLPMPQMCFLSPPGPSRTIRTSGLATRS